MCVWRSLVFQIAGRSHWWFLCLRMLGKGLLLKSTALLILFLWLVKFLKNLNKRLVGHLEKCCLFSDFQYGSRSSRSTADLMTVVFDKIARAFKRSGTTWAVAPDISKAFDRVWHPGLLRKLKSFGISGQIFRLILSFLSNRQLGVVLNDKSRVLQTDFKWGTITYAKSKTNYTSKFPKDFHIYDFEILSMCHSKSSNNNHCLLCFVRNQEYQ